MKMGGGYKVQAPLTLLLVILIALTVKVTDQLDMALYQLGPERRRGRGTSYSNHPFKYLKSNMATMTLII